MIYPFNTSLIFTVDAFLWQNFSEEDVSLFDAEDDVPGRSRKSKIKWVGRYVLQSNIQHALILLEIRIINR